MRMKVLNIVLGTIMMLTIVLSFAAARDFSRPNFEIMPDMYHEASYRAFEENENTKNGSTLRLPPSGSISRGLMPFEYERTEQDALRAGEELTNPKPIDDAKSLARGAEAYAIYCQHCHGPGGEGDGMVARRGFPPPPSLLAEHAVKMKDGQIFHIGTLGQGNMPGHAAQISRDNRWNVINHIRSLQASARKKSDAARPKEGDSVSSPAEGAQP